MSPLQLAKERCANNGFKQHRRLARIISYPPASTGTNYNLVEQVEHHGNERSSGRSYTPRMVTLYMTTS
jgi:hypothetical protein